MSDLYFIYDSKHSTANREERKQRMRVAVLLVKNEIILLVQHVHPDTKDEWWVPSGGGLEENDGKMKGANLPFVIMHLGYKK